VLPCSGFETGGERHIFMARYRIMYWKHIPQSFTVEGEGRTVKKQLSQRIQNAIDAYAMAEGATSTTEYAAQYKRGNWVERDGSPEAIAESLLSELEAEFARIEIPRRNGSS
jgi:metal-dependent amidase/aminoacylase/carboxypeptidase family protein